MRKNLLLMMVMAFMLPCLAWADNMAIDKKRAAAYGSSNITENRLGIPLEACGFSNPMNGSENYTVAAWIKPSNVANNAGVILALSPQVHMNANGNWVLKTTSTGALSFAGHGGENHGAASVGLADASVTSAFTRGITIDEWNYVTVVVDNANLHVAVYVNGENALDTDITGPLYFPANLANGDDGPGWFHVGGYALDALIDEVHGFNRALTADEVAQAYQNPVGMDGLTGYYTFDEQNGIGYFDNLATNAAENSSAVFWKWAGSYLWGGWVNGSNQATEATLTEGRELAQTPKYALTVEQPEGGVITVMNGEEALESGAEIAAGAELTLSVALESGYSLVNFTLDGQPLEGNAFTMPEAACTISATLAQIDYCAPEGYGNWSNGDGRGINSLDVNGVNIQGSGSAKAHALFTDATSTVVCVTPGENLTIHSNGEGEWMHTFVYIDFDNDGWTVDKDATTVNGDLVWFNQMAPEKYINAPAGHFYDGDGNFLGGSSSKPIGGLDITIPIPDDLAPGDYRVRYKVDWASTNPCGNPSSNNQIADNGGCMIDFTLRVVGEGGVVSTRTFDGKAEYYASGELLQEYPNKTLILDELSDGTYKITVDNVPEDGESVMFEGITREGVHLSGSAESFIILGTDLGETTLEGMLNSTGITVEINGLLYGYMPVTLKFVSDGFLAAIDAISGDLTEVPAEYFTLQGIRVPAANLTSGLYIVRRGNTVSKVYIRR